MPLSPKAKRAFDQWMSTSTWFRQNLLDEQRFFQFVWAVLRYSRNKPDGQDVRQMIVETWEGKLDPDLLSEKAHHYANLYITLCEFVKTGQRC